MSKRTIIGLIILLTAVVSLMTVILYIGYQKSLPAPEGRQSEPEEITQECYYIMDTDGYVTVYLSDQTTIYEETSIPISELSAELQQKLKNGIKVETIGQVYGFLENYSS